MLLKSWMTMGRHNDLPSYSMQKGKRVFYAREPLLKGKLSKFDLLVLNTLGQLLMIFRISYITFYKTSYLNEVNCTEPSLLQTV
jgi:hypothetical protein